jgi:hypothetical protein
MQSPHNRRRVAEDNSDGNGSLIIGMIILGAAVCVMIYCGFRQS